MCSQLHILKKYAHHILFAYRQLKHMLQIFKWRRKKHHFQVNLTELWIVTRGQPVRKITSKQVGHHNTWMLEKCKVVVRTHLNKQPSSRTSPLHQCIHHKVCSHVAPKYFAFCHNVNLLFSFFFLLNLFDMEVGINPHISSFDRGPNYVVVEDQLPCTRVKDSGLQIHNNGTSCRSQVIEWI